MRNKLKHTIFIFIMLLFSLLLLPGYRTEAATVEVKLNKTSVTLYTNGTKTVKLKATVTGSTKKVKWSSSNKKVATVSSSGKVTAKATGTATITAKVAGKTAKCKITVKKKTDAKVPSIAKTQTAYWYIIDPTNEIRFYTEIPVKNATSSHKISSVKCSGSNSTYEIKDSGWDSKSASVWAEVKVSSTTKPSGTVTISFNLSQNGKTYKLSSKITLKQLPDNIIKSLKIGSDEYAPCFKNGVGDTTIARSLRENDIGKKISVKLATGCKLKSIYMKHYDKGSIPNGSVVSEDMLKDGLLYLVDDITINVQIGSISFEYHLNWAFWY